MKHNKGDSFNQVKFIFCLILVVVISVPSDLFASNLNVGVCSVDMTPPLPVSLDGQMRLRVAKDVQTPLTASIVVLEVEEGDKRHTSIWVSLELVVITNKLKRMIQERVEVVLPEVDSRKIIINATHTHTGPATREGNFILPEGVTTVEETLKFLTSRVTEGIQKAWENRKPGSVSWGKGFSKIAVNRRAVYYDGSAKMYGKTNLPEFRKLEGIEDHDLNVLYFWDEHDKLIATCINVSCPAQEVEGRSSINADFWYPVRKELQKTFGENLVVLGWIGAAGDMSPHLMYAEAGDDRMRKLRGLSRLDELARRITEEVIDIYGVVNFDKHADVELIHEVRKLQLPRRLVTVDAVNEAEKAIKEIENDEEKRISNHRLIKWHNAILERYKEQQQNPDQRYEVEIHIVRLGDIAICTNPFELFTEYGIRIKARSPAVQTFVLQLVGSGTYLPTMEALRGGHYSAIIQSNEVGPEGGDMLVEQSIESIHKIWLQKNSK